MRLSLKEGSFAFVMIALVEAFSQSKVIAITISHEDMEDDEVDAAIVKYERRYKLPTTDVLMHGCQKLVALLREVFPELGRRAQVVDRVGLSPQDARPSPIV